MKTSCTFAPDSGALFSQLEVSEKPILVLDPCGKMWEAFWHTPRWNTLWQAWRLAPGQTHESDVWDVLGALHHVRGIDGSTALATALFPEGQHSELTRRLMTCVMTFADDTGHFSGCSSGLGALAGQVWADDLWTAIARWSRQYPNHKALQKARALLTCEGAGDAVLAIRDQMFIFHHPHVAETFTGTTGINLGTLRLRPGQIIFLTPDIRCMESPELTSVYSFLLNALQSMATLHHVNFSLLKAALAEEGIPCE